MENRKVHGDGGGGRCSGGGYGENHRHRSREGGGDDGNLKKVRSGKMNRYHFVLIGVS